MEPRQSVSSGAAVAGSAAKTPICVGRSNNARRPSKPTLLIGPFRRALTSAQGSVFDPINVKKLIGEAR